MQYIYRYNGTLFMTHAYDEAEAKAKIKAMLQEDPRSWEPNGVPAEATIQLDNLELL